MQTTTKLLKKKMYRGLTAINSSESPISNSCQTIHTSSTEGREEGEVEHPYSLIELVGAGKVCESGIDQLSNSPGFFGSPTVDSSE